MSAGTNKVVAPQENAAPLENADSGIVRVPYDAISRPLSNERVEGVRGGFMTEQRLADLFFRRRIQRAGRGVIVCDQETYDLYEGIRVVRPAHGHDDPYGLSGVEEHLEVLLRAGAIVGPASMHLGSATYQIVRGVIAVVRAESAPIAG